MPKATPDAPKTRRCEFEPGSFPEGEFELDPKWGWIHTHRGTPRHNSDGNVIPPDGGRGRKQPEPPTKAVGLQKVLPAFLREKQPLPPLMPRDPD